MRQFCCRNVVRELAFAISMIASQFIAASGSGQIVGCPQAREVVPTASTPAECAGGWRVTEVAGRFVWERLPSSGQFESACFGSLPTGRQSGYVIAMGSGLARNYLVDPQAPGNEGIPADVPEGFSTNISPLYPLMPGDFLPPSPQLGMSSECLLPPGAGSAPTGWQGSTRPTLEGKVDLITGLPMIQVTDLELPFDGATFRLNRTRSAKHPAQRSGAVCFTKWDAPGPDKWWDWAGQGWMISENPVLLIDSKLPDAVGNGPATCWVILDAHRSIPFQQVGNTNRYEAPPRFRAAMTVDSNAVWGSLQGGPYHWTTPPTEYKVSLYDGALTYTFVAIRDDVPPKGWNAEYLTGNSGNPADRVWVNTENGRPLTYHERPLWPNSPSLAGRDHNPFNPDTNPGLGIPHYGICTRIEDRYGHRVEIEYSSCTRTAMDTPRTPDCIECYQNCLSKGQIRAVRLYSGTELAWTLVYVHRLFPGVRFDDGAFNLDTYASSPNDNLIRNQPLAAENGSAHASHGHVAVDRIYVIPGAAGPVTLPSTEFLIPISEESAFGSDEYNPLLAWGATQVDGLWLKQVRYHYSRYPDPEPPSWENPPATEQNLRWRYAVEPGRVVSPPLLLMTSVKTRPTTQADAIVQTKNTVFGYGGSSGSYFGFGGWDPHDTKVIWNPGQIQTIPWLQAIYSPDDLSRLMSDESAQSRIGNSATGPRVTAVQLATQMLSPDGEMLQTPDREKYLQFASVRLDPPAAGYHVPCNDCGNSAPTSESPTLSQFVAACGIQIGRYRVDLNSTSVRDLSVGNGTNRKYYRIHRFLIHPKELPDDQWRWLQPVERFSSPSHFFSEPMCSVFLNPYYWQNYSSPVSGQGADPSLVAPPATINPQGLTEPRFLAVIDEFSSLEEMQSADAYSNGAAATKPGQVSRRVVGINAWGFVLTDRRWDYTVEGTIQSGSGVGEQYVYSTVGVECGITEPQSLAEELVLTEHRSAGWSVGNGATEGLITFYEYGVNTDPGLSEEDFPWSSRLHQTAEGIKQGTSGTKLYRAQHFYSQTEPDRIEGTVRFMSEQPQLLISLPPFGPGVTPDPNVLATHFLIERDSNASVPVYQRRVLSTTTIDPPQQQRPGGSWFYPVHGAEFNDQGEQIWQLEGLVTDPLMDTSSPPDPLDTATLAYTLPGPYGPEVTVFDAVPNTTYQTPYGPPRSVQAGSPRNAGWVPLPAGAPRLERMTSYEYDERGVTDIWYPNGTRYARRAVVHDPQPELGDEWTEEYEFFGLRPSGTQWTTDVPGSRKEFAGTVRGVTPRKSEKGYYPGAVSLSMTGLAWQVQSSDTTPRGLVNWQVMRAVTIARDANGRAADATSLEAVQDAQGAYVMLPVGHQYVNDLGEMYRTQDMDGTITRLCRNSLGQVLRRYVGTSDVAWSNPGGGMLPYDPEIPNGQNNLVLVERTDYGAGVKDVWLPTVSRSYTTNVGMPGDWHRYPFGAPPLGDVLGAATVTSYDWRMRAVRRDEHSEGLPGPTNRVRTTLTFLDHGDRPVLEVVYGGGSLPDFTDGRDPALLGPSSTTPQASEFLRSGELRPFSITQTVYGADGKLVESRSYDTGGTGTPGYQSDYEFRGFGGAAAFTQSPGNPVQVSTVDALGRVTSTATVVPQVVSGAVQYSREIARTDFTFDDEGNPIREVSWERIVDAPSASDTLTPANAVWTMTLSWYDHHNRLVAVADYGTGQLNYATDGTAPTTPAWYPGTSAPAVTAISGTITVDRGSVPVEIPLTVNGYNSKGEREYVASPREVVNGANTYDITRTEYTGSGKVARVTENAGGAQIDRRTTSYRYSMGRLSEVVAAMESGTPSVQSTKVWFGANPDNAWGAEVIDLGMSPDSTRIASRTGALTRSMHLPKSTGEASLEHSVLLRYDFRGRLAERVDARGVVARYAHDAIDRLISIEFGHYEIDGTLITFNPKLPETVYLPSTDAPVDRVGFVQLDYSPDLRTVDAYAYDSRDGTLIAHTRLEHDAKGNLVGDWQSIGEMIGSTSPKVAYTWDVQFASVAQGRSGHTRLATMIYPIPPEASIVHARVVSLGYGASGSAADFQSLITSLTSTPSFGGDPTSVATFSHVGAGRRARSDRAGGAIVQDLGLDTDASDNSIGLAGLDPRGRLTSLKFLQGSPAGAQTTLTCLDYVLDDAGNRISCVRTPKPIGTNTATFQEQANAYDALNRLVASSYTNFDSPLSGSLFRSRSWALDTLGNWKTVQTALPNSVSTLQHTSDHLNQYTQLLPSGANPVPVKPVYDLAGNLVFDGVNAFQYDGWGRVIQVNRATLPANAPQEIASLVIGPMVKHYTYDAFGRLIRVQSPFPDPESGGDFGLRVERLYYDGLRRIQEVNIDPSVTMNAAMAGSAGTQLQATATSLALNAEEELDGSAAPAALEVQALGASATPLTSTYLAREYVWGPGDWGPDELLVQYDSARRASWPLQDAGGDVIALCDRGGANGTARVITQLVYDAYGAVIGRDDPATPSTGPPELRVGHKGLFFDRLDGGIADPFTGEELPRLEPGARLSGYARNRTLHCDLGRWNQRDPNATGIPVMDVLAIHGQPLHLGRTIFDQRLHFADGVNSYAYLRIDPVKNSDPTGLFSLVGGLMTGMDMAQNSMDAMDQAYSGVATTLGLGAMVEGYGFWQQYDVEWATDWSAPDDGYSGSAAMATYSQLAAEAAKGPIMAGARGPGRLSMQISRMARSVGKLKPSLARINAGLQKAQKILGGSPPRAGPAKFGSPQWSDGVRGYRLDPPHPPRPGRPLAEGDWHINWWDKSTGQKGVIPL